MSQNAEDTIAIQLGSKILKPIYTEELKQRGSFYYWLWGKHYSELYYKPIMAKTTSPNSLFGGLSVAYRLPKLHSLIVENKQHQLYLLKPLGGASSFLESKIFRDIYQQEEFKDTYMNDFIKDAYTIVHPYMFLVSERLAKSSGLGAANPTIFYVTQSMEGDSIADVSLIENKLVSISQLPDVNNKEVLIDINHLLNKLHSSNMTRVDEETYIKARLFDMLIGDWNKIPENWYWISSTKADSVTYYPQVINRNHGFTKVDGLLFKQLIKMLGVGFITNYEERLKNIRKFNDLSFALDIALTQYSDVAVWQEQARSLQNELNDEVIDKEFASLPEEMQGEETERLKQKLKSRKKDIEDIAIRYYALTQKAPVITGTNGDDRFVIEQDAQRDLHVRIYDRTTNTLVLDKKYTHGQTKQIWIYALGGNDSFEVDKTKKAISVSLIGGKGTNDYKIEHGQNVTIYETKSEKERLKSLMSARLITPSDENTLSYDYQRLHRTTFSIVPIGIYDSDLGLNLGTSLAYTIYGFRRTPYTRRHQISYNYIGGFTYQGIFPTNSENKKVHLVAFLGSPNYFNNFFGFGNNTYGHRDADRNFNRVNINKYMLTPSLYYTIDKTRTFNIYSSFEVYKVQNPEDRFINQIYDDDHSIFSEKSFFDLGATYELKKKMPHFVSSLNLSLSAGWKVNLSNLERNFVYLRSRFGINLRLTDRITFATLVRGVSLSSDKYDFFQAATIELRGFRQNRFIGQHSLYQYSDIRFDMGRLQNPFTPINYGIFVGADHGRVWYLGEHSNEWHSSYGGGFWLTVFRRFTGKLSYFGSNDGRRFMFEFGMGF